MHRILLTLILFLLCIPFLLLLNLAPGHYRYRFHKILSRLTCRIMNIKVTVKGRITKKRPVLFISNHLSYLDILVLGAVLPASFVSRADVSGWPILGWIANLTGTVFVDRKKSKAILHADEVGKAVAKKKSLIIFPEGTTGDGVKLLPFKSSLLNVVEEHNLIVQPLTLAYTHINGLPIHHNEKHNISWIGNMDLAPHVLDFIRLGKVRAQVKLHDPIEGVRDRKILAEMCRRIIADGK